MVPCKTEKMASRLVNIVTERLLSVEEAFSRLDEVKLASLLQPIVEEELMKEPYGKVMVTILKPVLPLLLTRVVANLKIEIESILDLRSVVLEAFMRDKIVLVELFQKVSISFIADVIWVVLTLTLVCFNLGWKSRVRFSCRKWARVWMYSWTRANDSLGHGS